MANVENPYQIDLGANNLVVTSWLDAANYVIHKQHLSKMDNDTNELPLAQDGIAIRIINYDTNETLLDAVSDKNGNTKINIDSLPDNITYGWRSVIHAGVDYDLSEQPGNYTNSKNNLKILLGASTSFNSLAIKTQTATFIVHYHQKGKFIHNENLNSFEIEYQYLAQGLPFDDIGSTIKRVTVAYSGEESTSLNFCDIARSNTNQIQIPYIYIRSVKGIYKDNTSKELRVTALNDPKNTYSYIYGASSSSENDIISIYVDEYQEEYSAIKCISSYDTTDITQLDQIRVLLNENEIFIGAAPDTFTNYESLIFTPNIDAGIYLSGIRFILFEGVTKCQFETWVDSSIIDTSYYPIIACSETTGNNLAGSERCVFYDNIIVNDITGNYNIPSTVKAFILSNDVDTDGSLFQNLYDSQDSALYLEFLILNLSAQFVYKKL